ncbi:MAG: RNA polymerase sigma factor [Bacteroidota bacterium]
MTDELLFAEIQANGKNASAAFEELYDRYAAKLYTYCLKALGNEELARDIFQEVFAKIHESTKDDREMTNFSGFIIRITRNLCINEKRRKVHSMISLEDFHMPAYEESSDQQEMKELLEMALESLPEEYREVIILKEFLDLSYKEIAEILDENLPVVRIRIYRAKNKIRDILSPYLDELKNLL